MTNRILLVFSLALVGVLALMMVYKLLLDAPTAIITVYSLQILGALSLICAVYGIRRHLTEKKKEIDTSQKLVCGYNITLLAVIVLFCCGFIVFSDPIAAIRTLYIIIPGFAVLYLIKMIFNREFFVISLSCAFGALLLWGASKILASGHVFLFPFCIALGLLCALALFLALVQAQKSDGVCTIGSFSTALMDRDSEYGAVYVTLAILVVLMLVSLFVKAQLITYFSFAVLGYLFILAVYYTVKLM